MDPSGSPEGATVNPQIGLAAAPAKRLRLAELNSSVGAGIFGAGIGVLLAGYLAGLGAPILALGLVLHAWGMRDKHAIEAGIGAAQVWRSTALYWTCWAVLAGLAVYAIARP